MKHLLYILLTAILCATASAQTIRALGYNSTNGQVVANTGTNTLRFTNNVSFQGGPLISGDGIFYVSTTNGGLNLEEGRITDINNTDVLNWADAAQLAVGRPLTFGTNASSTRANLGLGVTNAVRFGSILLYQDGQATNSITYSADQLFFSQNGVTFFSLDSSSSGTVIFEKPISFIGTNTAANAAASRTNFNLGLPALTNTSNVTMMRALSGSTNTNHPYSGSISVTGTNNTNTLVFSNGILQSVQ